MERSSRQGTQEAVTGSGSALQSYRQVVVGDSSLARLLYFEFCRMLAPVPGALGMVLRRVFWPRLFAACGPKTVFGENVVLRHPGRIRLGARVVISENCILDGRSQEDRVTIELGNDVCLSNNVMLSCKEGGISIGDHCGINAQAIIQSTSHCPVRLGREVIVGQRAFIVGGGSYNLDRLDLPIRRQGIRPDGGVHIADNVWIGAGAIVLGGVRMAEGSVAGAGAVVTRSVAEHQVCVGAPARVVRTRGHNGRGKEAA